MKLTAIRPTGLEWALLFVGLLMMNHYAWLLDDAFVFFRYVDNFVLLDSGLVYNRGEFVEGFTSPAWALLLSSLRVTGLDYWPMVRGLGALSFVATWWILIALDRELVPERDHAIAHLNVPLLYLAPNYAVLCYFTSGVETPLVQLCAVAYALFLLRPDRWAPSVAVGLSTLVRPELALATGLAFVWVYATERKVAWRMLVVAGTSVGAWVAVRVIYYAELLPNTFYLKHLTDWGQGLVYLSETASTYHVVPFGLALSAAAYWSYRKGCSIDGRARLGMLVIAAAIALYFVRIGGDPRHYRYLAFSFCLSTAATAGLADRILVSLGPGLAQKLGGSARARGLVGAAGIAFALLVSGLYPPQLASHPLRGDVTHTMRNGINDAAYHRQHERLSISPWSNERVHSAQPRALTGDYTEVTNASWCEWAYRLPTTRVIQNLGLTDPFLSRVDIRPDRPAHKSGLQPMAMDLEAVHRRYTAQPGMIRLALENGDGAAWMKKNLDVIEVIERKAYNRHALGENLRLALTFPGRIEP